MKINAKITLLFNRDGLHLELYDDDSNITFLDLKLNQEQTCNALSRLCSVSVEKCEVFHLDKLGKVQEYQEFIFEIPNDTYYGEKKKELVNLCYKAMTMAGYINEGWEADKSYNSQGSIFTKKDKRYASTTIRRWVNKI